MKALVPLRYIDIDSTGDIYRDMKVVLGDIKKTHFDILTLYS